MQRKREKEKPKKKEKKGFDSVDTLASILDEVTKTGVKSPSLVKKPQSLKTSIKPSPPLKVSPSEVGVNNSLSKPSQGFQYPISGKLEPGRMDPRIKSILPSWVSKPWRWMVPEDPQLKEQWLITWGEFLLGFSREVNLHILDLQEIALVYPFHNPLLRKKLTLNNIKSFRYGFKKYMQSSNWQTVPNNSKLGKR